MKKKGFDGIFGRLRLIRLVLTRLLRVTDSRDFFGSWATFLIIAIKVGWYIRSNYWARPCPTPTL